MEQKEDSRIATHGLWDSWKTGGGRKMDNGTASFFFFFIYIFNDGYELAKDTPPKYGLRNMGYGSGLFSKGDLIM